jgi:RNA recognition motif-containing protein
VDEDGFVRRRAYVGGMPFWYTEEQIREVWETCGEVEDITLLRFPDSGNFRGIVFVTFAVADGLGAALEYDGDDLEGKTLVVKRCRAPEGSDSGKRRKAVKMAGIRSDDTAASGDRDISKEGAALRVENGVCATF